MLRTANEVPRNGMGQITRSSQVAASITRARRNRTGAVLRRIVRRARRSEMYSDDVVCARRASRSFVVARSGSHARYLHVAAPFFRVQSTLASRGAGLRRPPFFRNARRMLQQCDEASASRVAILRLRAM